MQFHSFFFLLQEMCIVCVFYICMIMTMHNYADCDYNGMHYYSIVYNLYKLIYTMLFIS